MNKEIALQLFTVRDELAEDFAGTIEKIAAMGYSGVEVCRWRVDSLAEVKKIFADFNLGVTSLHVAIENTEPRQIIDDALRLGVEHVFTGVGAEPFSTVDKIKETAEFFTRMSNETARQGVLLGIHNHPDEMVIVEGIPAYRRFLDECGENVIWQIDTYWARVGGLDPVEVMRDLGPRCVSVHLKDGLLDGPRGGTLKPLGDGVMDIPGIIDVCADLPLIVEQDNGEGSMLSNVKRSVDYLSRL